MKFKTVQKNAPVFKRMSESLKTSLFGDINKPKEKKSKPSPASPHVWSLPDHPHAENIIKTFDEATEATKTHGMNWYSRVHHIAKGLGKAVENGTHKAAGVIASYSAGTAWPTNLKNASLVFKTGKAHGGKGHDFATSDMAGKASKILGGAHHQEVLGGHKTKAFARLIENPHDNNHDVCIDRHAVSIAIGRKLKSHEINGEWGSAIWNAKSPASSFHYNHVADAYRQAAKHLSEKHGRTIHPHQVQAVTWEHWRKKHNIRDSYDEDGNFTSAHPDQMSLPTITRKAPSSNWEFGMVKQHGHSPDEQGYTPVYKK